MTQSQHTPMLYYPIKINGHTFIKDKNGKVICCIDVLNKEVDVLERAKLITQALNNREQLVEALELIMDNLGWIAPVNGFALMPSETFIKIKKALKQAKE